MLSERDIALFVAQTCPGWRFSGIACIFLCVPYVKSLVSYLDIHDSNNRSVIQPYYLIAPLRSLDTDSAACVRKAGVYWLTLNRWRYASICFGIFRMYAAARTRSQRRCVVPYACSRVAYRTADPVAAACPLLPMSTELRFEALRLRVVEGSTRRARDGGPYRVSGANNPNPIPNPSLPVLSNRAE